MTASEALEQHGVSWTMLEKIAGGALRDAMRARNITLDPERRELAFEYFVDVGAQWAKRFDPELAGGVSFQTSLYRRLNSPPGAKLIDFLRSYHGDERRGTPLHEVPAGDRTDLVAGSELDEASFEQLIDHVGSGLTARAFQTLRTVAYDIAVLGLERWRVADKHGIDADDVSDLLEELGWQLRAAGAAVL